MKQSGYAYEAKDLKRDLILGEEPSSLSTSYPAAFQDAIVEVAMKARDLGFRLILFVSDCKRIAGTTYDDRLAFSNLIRFNFSHHFCTKNYQV